MKLFEAFKQYIIKHPRVAAYKPTSDKYDRDELFAILKKLGPEDMKVPQDEIDKVGDFLWITDLAHSLYKGLMQGCIGPLFALSGDTPELAPINGVSTPHNATVGGK